MITLGWTLAILNALAAVYCLIKVSMTKEPYGVFLALFNGIVAYVLFSSLMGG